MRDVSPKEMLHKRLFKPTHMLYWRSRLCRKHGLDTAGAIRRPSETNAQRLTQRVRNAIGKESQRRTRCSIEWCAEPARVHVRKGTGSLPACKLHASWIADPRAGTFRGLRKGRFAARCALADAVFGDMTLADLSPNGDFQHRCETCFAWYFTAESVPCPTGGTQRVFSRCCQHGRLADVPLLPPAPPSWLHYWLVILPTQRLLRGTLFLWLAKFVSGPNRFNGSGVTNRSWIIYGGTTQRWHSPVTAIIWHRRVKNYARKMVGQYLQVIMVHQSTSCTVASTIK